MTVIASTFVYDVADPVHPRVVCRSANTVVHLVDGNAADAGYRFIVVLAGMHNCGSPVGWWCGEARNAIGAIELLNVDVDPDGRILQVEVLDRDDLKAVLDRPIV